MDYLMLLQFAIGATKAIVNSDLIKNKLPAEIVSLGQAFLDGLVAHHNDVLTKANFEAQRG